MKILFAMSSPEYLRFYDATLDSLARRGHQIVIAVNHVNEGKPVRLDAVRERPGIAIAGVLPARDDRWTAIARAVRGTMDFARYLHPRLASAPLLRARMKRQALPWALQWLDRTRSLPAPRIARLMRGLATIENAIPPDAGLVRWVGSQAPDLVVVTPLVEAVSDQVDLVKAARACGIPTAVAVASWDNLTNKGDLRVAPDRLIVWNEAQRREAVELHRIDAATVAITGAQPFDRWFDRRPKRPREEFCRHVGLAADRPFVLYVGSSIFISRAEVEMPFVRRWIAALRAATDPAVRDIGVLVRPHPYNGADWDPHALDDLPGVAVWPRGGYNPITEDNRAGFFDSIYHSAAVTGINTSAMIEAAIVGRPVLSIAAPEFVNSQDGTLHFHHLAPENGGFLRIASTLEEHVQQLGEVLRDPDRVRESLARFVASFVRPHGVERPCTELLADAIEAVPRAAHPAQAHRGSRLIRALLLPIALLGGRALAPPARRKRSRKQARRVDVRVPAPIALAAAAPVLAATLLAGLFVVSELRGQRPFAYEPPRNVAEAAGMGLGPEVLRMLRQGADPNEVLPVRPDIISSEITRVTALEAAVWSRRGRLVRLLERHGALADPSTRGHLACLAADIRAGEIAEYLAPAGSQRCAPGAAVRAVGARSE